MNTYQPEKRGLSDPFDTESNVVVLPASKCGLPNFPANSEQSASNLEGMVNHALLAGFKFSGSFLRQTSQEPPVFEVTYCFIRDAQKKTTRKPKSPE